MTSGRFTRANSQGIECQQYTPNTVPQRGDEVHPLNGVDDYGTEVVVYVIAPNGVSDSWGCKYEAFKLDTNRWYSISHDRAYKWTNLAHIRETQRRLAEEILLGQT